MLGDIKKSVRNFQIPHIYSYQVSVFPTDLLAGRSKHVNSENVFWARCFNGITSRRETGCLLHKDFKLLFFLIHIKYLNPETFNDFF